MWVIQNTETKKFVTPDGSPWSYTSDLMKAQTYSVKPSGNMCSNERAVWHEDLMIQPI